MNNKVILQSFKDSFEVLKDSWATKKNAIIDCIVETEQYDGDLAMDMWLYILKKEGEYQSDYVGNNIYIDSDLLEQCVGNVFKAFFYKYEKYESPCYICKVLFDHVVPYIIKCDMLLEILFRRSSNMGYSTSISDSDTYGFRLYKNEYVPALIACVFLLDNPSSSQQIMNYMIDWTNNHWAKNNEDLYSFPLITVGELIRKSKEYIQAIYYNKDVLGKEYSITKRVKEALLGCVEKIEYAENKVECKIEVLSL